MKERRKTTEEISSQEIVKIIETWARATLNNLMTHEWAKLGVSEVAAKVAQFANRVASAKQQLQKESFVDRLNVIDAAGDIIIEKGVKPSDRRRGRRVQGK